MLVNTDLQHAQQLADTADMIALRYFRSTTLRVTTKPDTTPVTQGDLEVEKRLSEIVTTTFHEDYLGEEGTRAGATGRVWIVDPIDGTKNFLRGHPVWATLIALVEEGTTIASVVSAPALGQRWWAAKGEGAWTRDVVGTTRQLHVSGVTDLSDSFIQTSSLDRWKEVPTGLEPVIDLILRVWRHRAPGDFLGHMLVAEGAADACIEPNLKQWDIAAPALIITEAGGSVWSNATAETPARDPRIVISSNGLLEGQLRSALHL
jgi:histidinol-phosphatase